MKRVPSGSEERERVVYEFDAFRADPVRRVLYRRGEPVAITPKALSILLALLERAGEVVEKKELIERVWPGMFVSDANLTQNVFSLRKALGERAGGNRFIATVPGQGYSFVGDVQRLERQSTGEFPILVEAPPAAVAAPPVEEVLAAEAAAAPAALPAPPARRRFPFGALAVLAAMAVLAVVAGFLLRSAGKPSLPRTGFGGPPVRRAIAVLGFKSLSPGGQMQWLDTAFAEMLTTELAAEGSLRVILGETVAQARASLGLRDPVSLGPAELQRLHEALGADLLVVGSYLPLRDKIRLDVRVLGAPGGETVASLAEIGTEAELFDLVTHTGMDLRRSLELSEPSPQQVRETRALRLASAQAQKLYAEGLLRLRAFDPPGALPFLQQAAAADPRSPVIHSALSQAWSALGYDARAVEEARQARELAQPASREARLAIEGRFYKAAKNWEKASQTYLSLWTFHPDDLDSGLEMAESLMNGGRGAEAVEALAALRKLPPPTGEDPRIDLIAARNAWRLGDYATEKLAAERAAAKGRRSGQSLLVAQALVFEGQALEKLGRTREAIGLYRESAALCEKGGYQWGVGRALSNVGIALQILGDLEGARKAHEESLAIARRLGSAIGMASQLNNLGMLQQDLGDLRESLSLFAQSRQWYVRMGDRLLEVQSLNGAGAVLRAQGDLAAAQQRLERALRLSQSTGSLKGEAIALDQLGGVLAARGELGEARRRHEKAFGLLQRSGDPSASASALAAWADATARLGDLPAAWQQSAQALAATRQAGDRLGGGRVLGLRAWLAYEMGDLAASRALAAEQLRIARETGAKSLVARGLQNRGRAELAAGDLAAARGSFQEALRSAADLGETLRAMELRLDLAGLALASGRPGEAAPLAGEAAAWYQRSGIPGGEAEALSLLAEALTRQGRKEEGRKAAVEARARVEECEDRAVRVMVGIRLARSEVALGEPREALELLRHATAEAARSGLAAAGLEARLGLAELQRSLNDPAAEAALAAVRKEARERGFKRLAGPPFS
ncbi:MAG TPA: tetratricopeptide repeat protein [Thermoanaerobaculia bacterium]